MQSKVHSGVLTALKQRCHIGFSEMIEMHPIWINQNTTQPLSFMEFSVLLTTHTFYNYVNSVVGNKLNWRTFASKLVAMYAENIRCIMAF